MTRAYVAVAGVAGLLAVGLIAASLVGARAGESAPPPTGSRIALLSGIPQQEAVLGRPEAPVTLVEFADLQCPYCAAWADGAFAELVRDYVRPGKVRIVFSVSPLSGSTRRPACASPSRPAVRGSSGSRCTSSTRAREPRTPAGSRTIS